MRLSPIQAARTLFGYNAVEDKGRRQAPQKYTQHEAKILTPTKHGKLRATTQEQIRNHALVAWMVRKHLDYVSKFHISFKTDLPDLDALVNRIFKWHGKPRNLDHGRRFGRDELFRLFELEKVVCGDAALLKLDDLRLQAIESDLIAQGQAAPGTKLPDGINSEGLIMGGDGAWVEQYAICHRGETGGKVIFDHLEPAENVIFDGYWTRLASQRRGISPLATAINTVQDIHEAFEFNLIKAKMHALFGMAIFRDPDTNEFGGAGGSLAEVSGTAATASDSNLDLNPRAVNILDLNAEDKVQVLESGTPSGEFVDGSYLFIQIAMLALDIPITCFDSRRSSFSARIADLNEYEVSVESKRTKNRYVLQEYSDWVLAMLWNSPQWQLGNIADRNGMDLRAVQEAVEWIPSGSPWLDKYKQVQGDDLAISLGLDNAIDAARRRGSDVFKNIEKQAKVIAFAKANGVPLTMGKSGVRTVEEIVSEEVTEQAQEQPA